MNNPPKVCMLTSVHPPFDVRIFHKESKSLAKAGYEVILIAQHDKEEVVDGIKIIPLPKPKNRKERFFKVVPRLYKLAKKEKADVYHFHDPELIPVGILLKIFTKAKVVYDVHELVYYQITDKKWLKFSITKKIIQKIYKYFENISIKKFNKLILAEDGYDSYFREKFRKQPNYIIIRNFPIVNLIDNTLPIKKNEKAILIYAGGLANIRSIKELIQAMEFIKDKAELWLLGKWETPEYEKECSSLPGWKYTKYLGLKPVEEVYSYMRTADIGLSILYPVKNYTSSLPVKAFEYMACSLPMIMSNFPYWKEIFSDCAVFVDPYNPEEIAEKILYLLENPTKAKELGKNGRKLILEKYSWEAEEKKLLKLYGHLLK